MSTPYHYTPRVPAAPHPTPLPVSAYTFPQAKSGRAPIHNPYDKFTQPEFDAWIGGITGALRHALGQDEEVSKEQEKRPENGLVDSYSRYHQLGVEESDDEPPDDSFAGIKSRRAKGKARDPREGPGLGKGDSVQPIEIVSSDEEDAQEVELSMVQDEGSDYDDEEDEEAQYQSEEEEEEYSWERGQSSSQPLPSPKSARWKQVVREEEHDEEDEDEEEGYYEEEGGNYGEFDEEEEEYDDDEQEDPVQPVRMASDEVIELISDDDEEAAIPPRKPREKSFQNEGDQRQPGKPGEASDEYDEYEEEEYEDDEDEESYQLGTAQLIHPQYNLIRRPRDDVYEDEEEGEEEGEDESYELKDDEIEEVQPIEEDTSFPPISSPALIESKPIDILDHWSGPRTYAEDFYSGGDVRVLPDTKLDPHHLGPTDADDGDGRGQVEDTDVVQPPDDDTSFPPRPEEPELEVDLPDPWEGPRTYAEDLYSGGDVRLSPDRPANAHFLGATDVDYVEELNADVVVEVDDSEEMQTLNEDTSLLHQEKSEPPVELPDPWSGPQIYAEDFYSGGDVRTTPSYQIDPSLLLGTGDVEDDIDNFLTPGALTPNQSEERMSFADNSAYQEDEEDEGQVIQPPTNHYVPSTTRRNQPIPLDAEFISIDDSDDELENDGTEDFIDDDSMSFMYPEPEEVLQEEGFMEIQEVGKEETLEVDELVNDYIEPSIALPVESFYEAMDQVLSTDKSHPSELELPEVSSDAERQEEEMLIMERSPPPPPASESLALEAEGHNMIEVDTASEYSYHQQAENADVLLPGEVLEPETASEYTVDEEPVLEVTVVSDAKAEAPFEDLPPFVEENVADESTETKLREDPTDAEPAVASVEEVEVEPSESVVDLDRQEPDFVVPAENASGTTDSKLDIEHSGPDVVDNGLESENDENLSTSHDEEVTQQAPAHPTASTSAAPSQPQNHGQLPTPPSEKGRYIPLPSMGEGDAVPTVPTSPKKHVAEIEEVPDEDADIPQPVLADTIEVEMDVSVPKSSEYSVEEIDNFIDEDAEGVFDVRDDGISLVSVKDPSELLDLWDEEKEGYSRFEEPRTEGRLTEEPADREMSLGVVSVSPEEAAAFQESRLRDLDAEANSSPIEAATQGPPEHDSISSSDQIIEEGGVIPMPGMEHIDSTAETGISVSVADTLPSSTDHEIPMPITADANVPDPVDLSSPSQQQNLTAQPVAQNLIPSSISTPQPPEENAPGSVSVPRSSTTSEQPPSQQVRKGDYGTSTQADGLFTPAESSVNTAPSEPHQEDMHSRILTSLAQALFGPGSSPGFLGGKGDSLLQSMTSTPGAARPSAPQISLPDVPRPLRVGVEPAATIGEDVFGEVQVTSQRNATTSNSVTATPTSLPYRPSILSMRVPLTRKPTDPILMADPYPYCLSTPTNSVYPGHEEASEEDTLDNSISSNSTLEKGAEDKDATGGLDDIDGLELQYPTEHASLVGSGGKQDQLDKQSPPKAGSSKQTSKRKRDSSPGFSQKSESPAKSQKGKGRKNTKSERRKSQPKNVIPEPTSDEIIVVKPRAHGKINERVKRAPSEVSQGSRASSGASVAMRMLQPTSRSSSVASSVHSHKSIVSQPSPTVNKPNTLQAQPSAPPVPPVSLFHAHGQKRKALAQKLSQASVPQTQTRKPELSRVPSVPHIPEQPAVFTPSASPLPSASTSDVSHPVPLAKSPIPSANPIQTPSSANPTQTPSSVKPTQTPSRQVSTTIPPVTRSTRSQCRYHRISLPKEEGGPRVCFLVPGCSLNDKELMEEEEIEDHGDATQEDSQRMVNDIESLGFDLNLIGIMRQLVGLDILREQEVFYLPQLGEDVHRKIIVRKPERSAMVKAPGESSSYAGSPGHSASFRSPSSNRAPPSVADSTSTSLSALRKVVDSEKGSTLASTDSESEPSDDEEPDAKRSRPSPPGEPGVMGPPATHPKGKKLKGKRRKKLDQTYQPDEEHEEASDGEQSSLRKRRKSMATRGVKRTRTSDVITVAGDDTEQRELKRLRPHSSDPEVLTPQHSTT